MARVEEVLEQLYRERYVGYRNAIAPLVGSREAAHDVVQEAFARALRDARKLRHDESAAAWVWRIALNGPYSVNGTDERHTRAFDTMPATVSTCPRVISGKIGSDNTSRAAASATGKSPARSPRSA